MVPRLRSLSLPAWTAFTFAVFLIAVTGFASNTLDVGFSGIALTFASVSGALTCCVKSDHPAKRALEVALALGAFGTIFYGYCLTESILLATLTLFIAFLLLVGIILAYIAPKIQSRSGKD